MKGDRENKKKLIFIITGEQSGDSNAAKVINELKKSSSDFDITGIGGIELEKEGMELLYNYKEVNFIGLYSVIKNIRKIKGILNNCVNFVKKNQPELVVLVDFPSFNLKFAESIKSFFNGKIIYYISPQVWVWNTKRVEKIKKLIDRMLVIYPFEVDFYKNYGINAEYVGNPLLKRIQEFLRENKKINNTKKTITLLPGSRDEEFKRNLLALVKPIKKLKEIFDCNLNLLLSPNIVIQKYDKIIEDLGINIKEYAKDEEKYNLILNSDLVITKFGTSSTECAFLETPFITIYKANPINYYIAKKLVKVKYVTLINFILNSLVVKEFIQHELTSKNICDESIRILNDENYRLEMIYKFRQVKKILLDYPIKKSAAEIINEYLFSS